MLGLHCDGLASHQEAYPEFFKGGWGVGGSHCTKVTVLTRLLSPPQLQVVCLIKAYKRGGGQRYPRNPPPPFLATPLASKYTCSLHATETGDKHCPEGPLGLYTNNFTMISKLMKDITFPRKEKTVREINTILQLEYITL